MISYDMRDAQLQQFCVFVCVIKENQSDPLYRGASLALGGVSKAWAPGAQTNTRTR